jgi:ABC-type branched-subunit amino acid transport system substrate-binding protein
MKHPKKAKTVFLILSLAIFVCLGMPGKGSAEKPNMIKIGLISDLSGPYAPSHSKFILGAKDACEYVNGELGGVNGVPIAVESVDTGNKVDMAVYHYMKFREMKPKPFFLMLGVSGEAEALRPRLAEDKIPGFVVTSLPCVYPAAYSFGAYPTYPDQFGHFVDWLAKTWNKNRPARLAFLTWDTTFGRAVLTEECYAYAKSKGIEIVATELFGIKDLDVTTQLVRINAKKADWIFTNTAFQGTVIVAKGLREIASDIKLAGGIGIDESTMRIDPKSLDGVLAVTNALQLDPPIDEPAIAKVMTYFNKNHRTRTDIALMYSLAWYYVSIAREGISRAVQDVGWDRLSGQAVRDQMVKMNDILPIGKGSSRFSYTEKKRTPSALRIFQIKEGKFVPITDWKDGPDLRPAQYK